MAEQCPYHADHTTRIERLEDEMKEVKKAQTNPALWVALFGVVGTMVSTLGAFCGVVAVAYFRAKGIMP